jgi:2,4-didehydro-3-deoxy-L-rhamnonate hydrolase
MRLVRYGPRGHEKPGLLDRSDVLRDLSDHIPDITPEALGRDELARLASLPTERLPAVRGAQRLGVPLTGVRQFIAVGLNFEDHARESNLPVPDEPVLFTKAVSCLSGPYDDVILPRGSSKVDWEVELGLVVGTAARYVTAAKALDHLAGFVLVNDVSERAFQMERGGTWDKGKGCETFGPVGPWLATPDEVGDFDSLGMWLDVNDCRMQDGNTRTMIFKAPALISYISQFMTLLPGDVITTGTPPGVGLGQKPHPVYLKAGDVMRLGIDKLGEQRQAIIACPD